MGLLKRLTMPYFSALRFLKHSQKCRHLSPEESLLYIPRPEENEIARLLKCSRKDFFVISGPKKVGKAVLLKHLTDTALRKRAIYLKLEQKATNAEEIYKMLGKIVGYHPFYEESLLSSMFCFWRMFQSYSVEHHAFGAYLERVGKIYQRLNKGKLPLLIIDGADSLTRDASNILDDLAYMAKALAEARAMILVFGVLDAFGLCVLNSRGYNINKHRIKLSYIGPKELEIYANKVIANDHPLRELAIKTLIEQNQKIYGGNFQYNELLVHLLENATTDEDVSKAVKDVKDRVFFDASDELKKSTLKDQTVMESTAKLSMVKAFNEISKSGSIPVDKFLSFFKKEDQPLASHFLYQYSILTENNDEVSFQGKYMQYYIEQEILERYMPYIIAEDEEKKNKEMKEYMYIIQDTIIDKNLKVKWDDLVGLENAKQKMLETIILPSQNPSLFTGLRAPAKGVLFYGPPGNGKTMVAKALASECGKDVSFFNVSSSTFTSKTAGRETDKLIKALFSLAIEKEPSVIFIDEMDSILSKRVTSDTEDARLIKNEFLLQLEGITGGSNKRIVVIGATNRPFDIDEAILRLFPIRIYLDLPSDEARKITVKKMLSKVKTELSEEDYEEIVKKTYNFSFADLAALCREASYEPIRKVPAAEIDKIDHKDVSPVTMEDFNAAFLRVTRSVSEETLDKLLKWNTN